MKKIIFMILIIWVFPALAQTQNNSFGQVATNLLEPVGLLSDFVNTACMIIGSAFLFASLIKYIEHRRSPLMVPISTVVFLVIAGLALIALPILSYVTGYGVQYSLMKH